MKAEVRKRDGDQLPDIRRPAWGVMLDGALVEGPFAGAAEAEAPARGHGPAPVSPPLH